MVRSGLWITLLVSCTPARSAPAPSANELRTPVAPAAPRVSERPTIPPSIGDARVTDRVVLARPLAAVGDGPATDRPTYARADQRVRLYALLLASDRHGRRVYYSDAHDVVLAGKHLAPSPLARAPATSLQWNRIEPAESSMSNGDTPRDFHFEPIDYRATPIATATNRGAIDADVRPTLTVDHGHGVGTMRYQLVAHQGDRAIASPGPEARRGRSSGGLDDSVLRVTIRRDDSYLGYLTELYGQPYIWASAGTSDPNHQSEHLEGSDCADFVVYGWRRLGHAQPYTWTGALPHYTRLLEAGTRDDDGIYRDHRGEPLPFTRAGDLVLFPRHVGVLTVDRGTPGVLDDRDLMMHALFDTPKEQPIGDSGYADKPLELRRWR